MNVASCGMASKRWLSTLKWHFFFSGTCTYLYKASNVLYLHAALKIPARLPHVSYPSKNTTVLYCRCMNIVANYTCVACILSRIFMSCQGKVSKFLWKVREFFFCFCLWEDRSLKLYILGLPSSILGGFLHTWGVVGHELLGIQFVLTFLILVTITVQLFLLVLSFPTTFPLWEKNLGSVDNINIHTF